MTALDQAGHIGSQSNSGRNFWRSLGKDAQSSPLPQEDQHTVMNPLSKFRDTFRAVVKLIACNVSDVSDDIKYIAFALSAELYAVVFFAWNKFKYNCGKFGVLEAMLIDNRTRERDAEELWGQLIIDDVSAVLKRYQHVPSAAHMLIKARPHSQNWGDIALTVCVIHEERDQGSLMGEFIEFFARSNCPHAASPHVVHMKGRYCFPSLKASQHPLSGVVSNLAEADGTGAESTAQETSNISFPERNACPQ